MRTLHWSWIAACVTYLALVVPPPAARAAQPDERPLVRLIATGGTIANRAGARLTAAELSASVPALDDQVAVEAEQFSNVASGALTLDDWLRLARRINRTLAARDDLAGVVVTSGTDTLEETAYFLNLTVRSERPVVVVGAMRPPGSIGYDGAANLQQGLRVAAEPAARGRGVLVVLNNEINAARDVTKTHAQRLHAFTAGNKGVLGVVDRDRVVFYRRPLHRHTRWTEFDLRSVERLPRVDILMTYLDAPGDLVRAAVDAGAEGLVLAAAGAGSTTRDQSVAIGEAIERGRPVVITTRTGGGRILPRRPRPDADAAPGDPRYSALRIEAEDLTPVKARILLMLALTRTRDGATIQRMFQQY